MPEMRELEYFDPRLTNLEVTDQSILPQTDIELIKKKGDAFKNF
jgi:hypothetical protein